jgi:hypothetical protein
MHNYRKMKTVILIGLLFSYVQLVAQLSGSIEDWRNYLVHDRQPISPSLKIQYREDWRFETRYNYESDRTVALYAGKLFQKEGDLNFEILPFGGSLFGKSRGFTAGVQANVVFKKFYVDCDSQFSRITSDTDQSFFLSWAETGREISNGLTLGIVGQHTALPAFGSAQLMWGLSSEYCLNDWMISIYGLFKTFHESNVACRIVWNWGKSTR